MYVISDVLDRVLEGEFLSLVLWINGTRNNALILGAPQNFVVVSVRDVLLKITRKFRSCVADEFWPVLQNM